MDEALKQEAARLEGLSAEARLEWALKRFGSGAVATSSFGADSAVLLHLISTVAPGMKVMFIDTGFHFPETLAYVAQLKSRLKLNLEERHPEMSRQRFFETYGDLHQTDPDTCCYWNKVQVLDHALEGASCWVNGLRRGGASTRAQASVLEMRLGGVYKLHPIIDWDRERVNGYLAQHNLPRHPLVDKGYLSIGCEPCTNLPVDGDERSGRWAGKEKTECGLHTFYARQGLQPPELPSEKNSLPRPLKTV